MIKSLPLTLSRTKSEWVRWSHPWMFKSWPSPTSTLRGLEPKTSDMAGASPKTLSGSEPVNSILTFPSLPTHRCRQPLQLLSSGWKQPLPLRREGCWTAAPQRAKPASKTQCCQMQHSSDTKHHSSSLPSHFQCKTAMHHIQASITSLSLAEESAKKCCLSLLTALLSSDQALHFLQHDGLGRPFSRSPHGPSDGEKSSGSASALAKIRDKTWRVTIDEKKARSSWSFFSLVDGFWIASKPGRHYLDRSPVARQPVMGTAWSIPFSETFSYTELKIAKPVTPLHPCICK